jgi:hypothetical protein
MTASATVSTLFELTPVQAAALGKSQRTQDWSRRAALRRAAMQLRYGKGPEGQTCKGCVHLIRRSYTGCKSFLKCDPDVRVCRSLEKLRMRRRGRKTYA